MDRIALDHSSLSNGHARRASGLDILLILLAANALILHYHLVIIPAPCEGPGDCVKYSQMWQAFREHTFLPVDFPFNQRVLSPFLASLVPVQSAAAAFQVLNAISYNIFTLVFYLALRRLGVSTGLIVTALAWMFLHPAGFPLYFSVPVSVDPLGYLFAVVAVAFIAYESVWLWPLVGVAGVLQKESFLSILLILGFCEVARVLADLVARRRPGLLRIGFVLLAIVLSIVGQHLSARWLFRPAQAWEVSSLGTLRWWLRARWEDPFQFLVWIAAIFIACGIFPILLAFTKRAVFRDPRFFWRVAPLAVTSAAYVVFGLVAGSDITRIVFNGLPFIFAVTFCSAARSELEPRSVAVVATLSLPILLGLQSGFPVFVEYAHYNGDHKYPIYWLIYVGAALIVGATAVWRIERSSRHTRAAVDRPVQPLTSREAP